MQSGQKKRERNNKVKGGDVGVKLILLGTPES